MGLWTKLHFYTFVPALLAFVLIAFITAKTLGKCKPKFKYIPLQVIAMILLILEVIKQIKAAEGESYDLYALPLHYCSLFLFLLPIHAFYHGKYSYITDTVSIACLASLAVAMILAPGLIYSRESIENFFVSFQGFHTVAFHNLVVFYFILTLALKLDSAKPRSGRLITRRDIAVMAVFYTLYVLVAAPVSYALEVNFHNLYRCHIAVLDAVRASMVDSLGLLGTLIYIAAVLALTILFAYANFILTNLLIKGIDKLGARKSAKQIKE